MELQLIQDKIHEIRGFKVMLDFDLSILYETETRILKQAVKRNKDNFPPDFLFELTKTEWLELITICDKLPIHIKHNPRPPMAFTEQGVAMLSSVLKSKKAIQVNIAIMRAFVLIRQFALNYKELAQKINELELTYNAQFLDIYEAIEMLMTEKKKLETLTNRNKIGYKLNA